MACAESVLQIVLVSYCLPTQHYSAQQAALGSALQGRHSHCHSGSAESGAHSGADWGFQTLGNTSGCHEENSVFGYYSQTTATCCEGHCASKSGGTECAHLLQRAGCLGNFTLLLHGEGLAQQPGGEKGYVGCCTTGTTGQGTS